ncbi:MAG: hypothetical protein PGN11_19240, partial [Quadrisphaera sp.]
MASDSALTVGVAAQLGVGDQAEERQQQLVERRDRAVREHRRPRGVDAGGQVVGHQLEHRGGQRADAVAVGDDLVVGHHQHHL